MGLRCRPADVIGSKESQEPETPQACMNVPEMPLSVWSLHLSPAGLEQQFWQSAQAQHVCYITDAIALGFTLANHGLLALGQLTRMLSPSQPPADTTGGTAMPMCFVVPLFLLPLMALLQIRYMLTNAKGYKRSRFAIAALNRLVRLAVLCLHAFHWKQHVFACGAASSSSSSTAGAWLELLRYLVAPHLIFLNHINFWVSFRFAFPLQLATLAVQLVTSQRLCICRMYTASLQAAAQAVCRGVRQASALTAGFLLGGLPIKDREVCSGVEAAAQLQFFSVTVLLLIIPTIVLYVLELSLKVGFLQDWEQQQPDRCISIQPAAAVLTNEAWVGGVLFVACAVAAWFVCESVIAALMPMSCDQGSAAVLLHWQGWHALLL